MFEQVKAPLGLPSVSAQPGKTKESRLQTATGNDPVALAVGDLDGDGRADVVTLNGDGTISVLLGQGDGTFLAAPSLASGAFKPNQGFFGSIALADLNGDGKTVG
jgi:FG-GAP-like repeat